MRNQIIATELRLLLRDGTLPVVGALLVLLFLGAAWNGARAVEQERAAQAQSLTRERNQRQELVRQIRLFEQTGVLAGASLPPNNAWSVGNNGAAPLLILPPAPLEGLALGDAGVTPSTLRASLAPARTMLSRDEIASPLLLATGRFDLAFVCVFLYPLLVIAFTFHVLPAEKEQGTLALALVQATSLGPILTGKLVARGAALAAVTTLAFLCALPLAGLELGQPATWLLALVWLAALLLYGFVWLLAAVWVNLQNYTSAVTASVLATLWLAQTLVLPAVLSAIATTITPVPSRMEMIESIRAATLAAEQRASDVLARYLQDHPELAPPPGAGEPDFASRSLALQQEVEKIAAPIEARYRSASRNQSLVLGVLRYTSMPLLAWSAFTDLAGTSSARRHEFEEQATRFHNQWKAWFAPRILQRQPVTASDLDRLPRFTFAEPGVIELLLRAATALAGLAGAAFLLAAAIRRALPRYPLV